MQTKKDARILVTEDAAEAHAAENKSHDERVADLAAALGEQLGLAPDEIALLHGTARLYDVRGITVPEPIFLKSKIAFSDHKKREESDCLPIWPSEVIPLCGDIVVLAEVFDALVSQRPHKASWPVEKARAEIVAQSGRHFDPAVVAAFLRFLENHPDGETETLI